MMFIIQDFYPVSLGFIFISYHISTLLEGLNLNLRRLNFINELPVGKGQKLAEKVKGGEEGLPRTYGLRPEKESNGRGKTLKDQLVFVNKHHQKKHLKKNKTPKSQKKHPKFFKNGKFPIMPGSTDT